MDDDLSFKKKSLFHNLIWRGETFTGALLVGKCP